MAENEYLGVGYSGAYRKSRGMIQDESCPTEEIAECVVDDLTRRFIRDLRRADPLKKILDAVPDRGMLRDIVEEFSHQTLARLVRDACSGGQSTDVRDVANRLIQCLIDGVLENTLREAYKHEHNRAPERCSQLRKDLETRLEQNREQLFNAAANSLRGTKPVKIPRSRIQNRQPESKSSVVNRSLLPSHMLRPNVNSGR